MPNGRKVIIILLIFVGILLLIFTALEISGHCLVAKNRSFWASYLNDQRLDTRTFNQLVKRNDSLKKKMDNYSPKGVYIVIDTAYNLIFLRKGSVTLTQATVSCGSGNVLEDPQGNRRWVFDTPRGEFAVQSKLRDPVWIKPDWAFIEEGKEIPSKFAEERYEEGVLGDYALGFGDGFFIHGTLYTRMLGRNVTHGCIRVGDEALKTIYKEALIGTKIYIY
ncbi:MAG: L,D-transpeptidase [Desulfobacterales bacterium]|jgi:L,D-transpeptidase YbiS|nr:L,D-transpeptidase [Acidobacteriota bacterium]MCU0599171.1 L,D-transpeptidase [Desulfobacterales bacterium]